jgi:hypothetical protein
MRLKLKHKDVLRFFKKVNQEGGCWLWTGFATTVGSGGSVADMPIFCLQNDKVYARRVAWLIYFNEDPPQSISTSCGNPLCVKPDHLEPRVKFGAVRILKTRPRRPFSLATVKKIAVLRGKGLKIKEIAEELNMDFVRIQLVLKMIRLCQESKLPKRKLQRVIR